jgi:ParB/RepB/Spo0J family partition protein
MTKHTPPDEFNEILVQGDALAAMKEAGAKRAGTFNLDVEEIAVLPDFNPRVTGTADYEDHINALTNSIIANGFLPGKPLTVFPAEETQEDGSKITVFYVVDGHSRLEAAKRAIAKGIEIATLPVSVTPAGTNLADVTAQTVINNNSTKPLSPIEVAIVVKRLMGYQMTPASIAARLGITERYISNLLVLAGAPAAVQEAVRSGKVSASLAVQELREHGDKAPARLKEATEKAVAAGKTKVTAKALPKAAPKPTAEVKAKVKAKVEKAAAKAPKAAKTASVNAAVASGLPASDKDFYREAILYALAIPNLGGLTWLTDFMAESAAAVGELESWMGQPAGAFFDVSLRVPVDKEGI